MNSILTFNISVSPEGVAVSNDVDALSTSMGGAPGPPSETSAAETAISSADAPGPPSDSDMDATSAADTGDAPGPPSDEEMTAAATMDTGDGPAPPGDFDPVGVATMEVDDAPPPLDVDDVDAEMEITPKKKTRATRTGRKKS